MTSLDLGTLRLPSRVFQSPMADCTDLPFRLIAREHGLALGCVEMMSANSLVRVNAKTFDMLKTSDDDRPLAAQLLGHDPGTMAKAAAMLEGHGVDLLDLNLGCSVRKVVNNDEGSALMKAPALAGRIFRAVRKALKHIPLTVKMRKGFEDESGREAVEIARIAECEGCAAVTVHGRTGRQDYSVKADHSAIALVKAKANIPVIGNGDIFSAADALAMARESSCDGVMVGRGGLGDPWLYREIEAALDGTEPPPRPSARERRDTLLRHLDLEVEHLGEHSAMLNMRRIGTWYTAGLPNAKQLRVSLCLAPDTRNIRKQIERFFDRPTLPPP